MELTPNSSKGQAAEVWRERPIYVGVLVGGASTRMGQSKSLLRFKGITFAEQIITAARARAEHVVLLGEGPVPNVSAEITRLPDVPGLAGPLAGMLAAMRWARQVCWIFIACDLPLLRSEALDWLIEQRQPGRWAVLPKVADTGVEPLLAVYEPEALELLEKLVARGRHSPHRLADEQMVYTPTPPADLCPCWMNVNTPEDLNRLRNEREG